jgi:hypothetical protein
MCWFSRHLLTKVSLQPISNITTITMTTTTTTTVVVWGRGHMPAAAAHTSLLKLLNFTPPLTGFYTVLKLHSL